MKLSDLAEQLGREHRGDDLEIEGIASAASAGPRDLTFVVDQAWLERVAEAGALLLPYNLADATDRPRLLTATPALDLAQVGKLLGYREMVVSGVHPTAVVDETARLADDVVLGPRVVIGPEVEIGAGTVIHAGAVIHDRTVIGERCVVGSNAVIGFDGFGYEFADGHHRHVPHFGRVWIGDDVEIGAVTCIDRARFNETRVGSGTKIDNLVHLAHNCVVGENVFIAAQAGFAGSGEIGDFAMIGGQVAMIPGGKIGPGAKVVATSGVIADVAPGAMVSGWWGRDHRESLRELAMLRKLPAFIRKVKAFMRKHED